MKIKRRWCRPMLHGVKEHSHCTNRTELDTNCWEEIFVTCFGVRILHFLCCYGDCLLSNSVLLTPYQRVKDRHTQNH